MFLPPSRLGCVDLAGSSAVRRKEMVEDGGGGQGSCKADLVALGVSLYIPWDLHVD